MPNYTVKSPLSHDGERYEDGEPVEMTAKQAKPLLKAGVLGEAKAEKKKDEK